MAENETPETDALVKAKSETVGIYTAYVEMIEHARSLERRLRETQEKLSAAEKDAGRLIYIWDKLFDDITEDADKLDRVRRACDAALQADEGKPKEES